MASTNKTTHYELSQYVASDKPTYLTDYNNDMSAIDTGIYNAQTKADSAYLAAGEADTKAGNAQTTANGAVTSAGTANTNIGTMANLKTTEKSSLVGAVNELNDRFDLTTFKVYDDLADTTNVTNNTNYSFGVFNITVATNADGSIFKIYGNMNYTTAAYSHASITLKNTGVNPSSSFSINPTGIVIDKTVAGNAYTSNVTVNANGDITINLGSTDAPYDRRAYYFPCLYFAKNFGDTPE